MRIAIPSEIKNHEYRVAITPVGVAELVGHGHQVFIEAGAGLGSSITDAEFVAQGATILPDADSTWAAGELVMKVKEPVAAEYHRLREDLVLFTYLHLAADRPGLDALLAAGTTAVAYETVQLPSGLLPLLYPMSEVAGCLAPQVGAHAMMKAQGGRGVLMGCVGGVAGACHGPLAIGCPQGTHVGSPPARRHADADPARMSGYSSPHNRASGRPPLPATTVRRDLSTTTDPSIGRVRRVLRHPPVSFSGPCRSGSTRAGRTVADSTDAIPAERT